MFETGRPAPEIVRELGLAQVSDTDALAGAVSQALAKFPAEVARYRGGEEKVFNWLLGQVMRETKGKGNPTMVRELLEVALRNAPDERRTAPLRPSSFGDWGQMTRIPHDFMITGRYVRETAKDAGSKR